MINLLVRVVQSPFFELGILWLFFGFITVICRPGTELEAWVKARGNRWWWTLEMIRKVSVEIPPLVDAAAGFIWNRTPEEASSEVKSILHITNINVPSLTPPFAAPFAPARSPSRPDLSARPSPNPYVPSRQG